MTDNFDPRSVLTEHHRDSEAWERIVQRACAAHGDAWGGILERTGPGTADERLRRIGWNISRALGIIHHVHKTAIEANAGTDANGAPVALVLVQVEDMAVDLLKLVEEEIVAVAQPDLYDRIFAIECPNSTAKEGGSAAT